MRSVLFVCTANVCRSPTAEGVLRRLLRDEGLGHAFDVDSVGTHDYHLGKPPFPAAADLARARGYDIDHLVARKVKPADFDHFDMILAMDRGNLASLRSIAPTRSKPKIELLGEYSEMFHGKDIPDPYGGKPKDYERALAMIEDACKGVVEFLKATTKRTGSPPSRG